MKELLEIPFQKFVLDNGLQVVIHEDHACSVVSVCVIYHVGSAREQPGRTGFAHLFEHLMFEGSKNVGPGVHFKLISEAGGTLNGTTNRDRTNYFETLPSHQLELALWLESDRMGFLLPAINQENLDNQRDVVKNERRQNYENRPYAKQLWTVAEHLYPPHHPYHWLTIGSHEDLSAATVEDVRRFFQRWYGPNNATIAIGGDVDPGETLALVHKYFGGIPRGPAVEQPVAWPVRLEHSLRDLVEDEVQLPEISLVWPTVPRFHADEAALAHLLSVLSANKSAVIDRALTVDQVLANQVLAQLNHSELAGEFWLSIRAAPNVSLTLIEDKVRELLAKVLRDGIESKHLDRLKSRMESNFIHRLETVASRTNALAEVNALLGDPTLLTLELKKALQVTPEDVLAALCRYLHEQPLVICSTVPRGRRELAAEARPESSRAAAPDLDRSHPPARTTPRALRLPQIQTSGLKNGVPLAWTHYDRLPLVCVDLTTAGGHLSESLSDLGLSLLTAELMNEGTRSLNTTQFIDELDSLGSDLHVSAGEDEINLSLTTLEKHVPRALQLLEEVLLHPRLSAEDFERLKSQRLSALMMRGDHARSIADNVWRRLVYGMETVAGFPKMGTVESVSSLSVEQAREFYRRHVVPGGANAAYVGVASEEFAQAQLSSIAARWTQGTSSTPEGSEPHFYEGLPIYLVHKAGATQSEIRIGHSGISRLHPDFDALMAMNYVLGGSFNSRINMNLREDKGYTYGAFSRFSGGLRPGPFTAWAAVHSSATAPSVTELLYELRLIREGISQEETDYARESMILAMGRHYESIHSLSELLMDVQKFRLPLDFLQRRLEVLRSLTKGRLSELAALHVQPERSAILVVGDAMQVRPGLEALSLGPVVELDLDGNSVAD